MLEDVVEGLDGALFCLCLSLFPLLFSPSNTESHTAAEAFRDNAQISIHVTYGEIKVNNTNMVLVQ